MHTIKVAALGFLTLGAFVSLGFLAGGVRIMALGALMFIPIWLCVSLWNLWVGVSTAGYGLREELPVLAVVFLVPALAALCVWLKVRS